MPLYLEIVLALLLINITEPFASLFEFFSFFGVFVRGRVNQNRLQQRVVLRASQKDDKTQTDYGTPILCVVC